MYCCGDSQDEQQPGDTGAAPPRMIGCPGQEATGHQQLCRGLTIAGNKESRYLDLGSYWFPDEYYCDCKVYVNVATLGAEL